VNDILYRGRYGNILKRPHPNIGTFKKIQELAAYREQVIKEKGKPPLRIPSCKRIGIGHRTIKKHAPELIARWKDKDFRW
jgi:hypothetical protein